MATYCIPLVLQVQAETETEAHQIGEGAALHLQETYNDNGTIIEAGAMLGSIDGPGDENAAAWRVYLPIHKLCEAAGLTGEGGAIDLEALRLRIEGGAELERIRAEARTHDNIMDDRAGDGSKARPPTGDDYNELFEAVMVGAQQTGCAALLSEALKGEATPQTMTPGVRDALEAAAAYVELYTPNGTKKQPPAWAILPNGDFDADAIARRARAELAETDPWHLFYIEACDADGTHAYMVSAQSGSELKAQELAGNAVLDALGTDEDPAVIEHCRCIGIVDGDIFEKIGLLAD